MNEYGDNFIIITDEEGNNYEVEHLFTFEHNNEDYGVFMPAGNADANDTEMFLLHVVYENGEEEYENIAEDIYDEVYEKFMEVLFETE